MSSGKFKGPKPLTNRQRLLLEPQAAWPLAELQYLHQSQQTRASGTGLSLADNLDLLHVNIRD
jgi:hypothetical protein